MNVHATLRHTILFGMISPLHSVSSLHPVPPWFNSSLRSCIPNPDKGIHLCPKRHHDSQLITEVTAWIASLWIIIRVNGAVLRAISFWECVREDFGISVKYVRHLTFFSTSLKIWNQGLFLKDRFFFVDLTFFQHEDFVSNTNTQKPKKGKKR